MATDQSIRFFKADLSDFDFWFWTALEVERFEMAEPFSGNTQTSWFEVVYLLQDRDRLLDDVRD